MSKALRFLQITAKQQYCPFFTVFLTIKTSSQNISITLLQISLKLHEHSINHEQQRVSVMRPLLLDLLCLTWVLLLDILTSRLQQPERIHQEINNSNQQELAAKVGVATSSRKCRRFYCE